MTKSIFALLCSGACLCGATGCQNEQQSTYVVPSPSPVEPKTEQPATDAPLISGGGPIGGGPVTTEPMTLSIEGAADRIAEAECKHQMHCTAKKDFDFSRCIANGRKNARVGLTYDACPKGVEAAKLESCLDAVQSGACKDIVANVRSSMKPCLDAQLCAK